MYDKDELKAANCTRDNKPIWPWELISIIVPLMKMMLIFPPSRHKSVSVFYHIFSLMPIDIHAIFQLSVSPAKPSKPAPCCAL
jgi:hypothetical protein